MKPLEGRSRRARNIGLPAVAVLFVVAIAWTTRATSQAVHAGLVKRAVGTWSCTIGHSGKPIFIAKIDANHAFSFEQLYLFADETGALIPGKHETDDGAWLLRGSHLTAWIGNSPGNNIQFQITGVSLGSGRIHVVNPDIAWVPDPEFVRVRLTSSSLGLQQLPGGDQWICTHTSSRSPNLKAPARLTPPLTADQVALNGERHGPSDLVLSGAVTVTLHTGAYCSTNPADQSTVAGSAAVEVDMENLPVKGGTLGFSTGNGSASVSLDTPDETAAGGTWDTPLQDPDVVATPTEVLLRHAVLTPGYQTKGTIVANGVIRCSSPVKPEASLAPPTTAPVTTTTVAPPSPTPAAPTNAAPVVFLMQAHVPVPGPAIGADGEPSGNWETVVMRPNGQVIQWQTWRQGESYTTWWISPAGIDKVISKIDSADLLVSQPDSQPGSTLSIGGSQTTFNSLPTSLISALGDMSWLGPDRVTQPAPWIANVIKIDASTPANPQQVDHTIPWPLAQSIASLAVPPDEPEAFPSLSFCLAGAEGQTVYHLVAGLPGLHAYMTDHGTTYLVYARPVIPTGQGSWDCKATA